MSLVENKKITFFKRTFSTLLLWGLVVGSVLTEMPFFIALVFLFFLVVGILEYSKMFSSSISLGNRVFLIFFTFIYGFSVIFLQIKGYKQVFNLYTFDIFFLIFFFLLSSFLILGKGIKNDSDRLGQFLFVFLGFIYVGFLFSFVGKLIFSDINFLYQKESFLDFLFNRKNFASPNATYLFFVIIVTKVTDIGAYLVGSLIGKHKAITHISPKKTWEGFVGGLFFGVLFGVSYYLFFKSHLSFFSIIEVVVISIILSILAIVGDLFESILKRARNVKDSGGVFPGIGGILDLIDSLCFTVPAFYVILHLKEIINF